MILSNNFILLFHLFFSEARRNGHFESGSLVDTTSFCITSHYN